jgi:prevent-host-death family protein
VTLTHVIEVSPPYDQKRLRPRALRHELFIDHRCPQFRPSRSASTALIDQVGHTGYRDRMPSKSQPPNVAPRTMINIAAAKARLPELVERAARGEEIVLARAGKPQARLVPLADTRKELRVPGKGKGRLRITRDFDAPLSDEVLSAFEGDEP